MYNYDWCFTCSITSFLYPVNTILCIITYKFDIEDEENILLKLEHDTTKSYFQNYKTVSFIRNALFDANNELTWIYFKTYLTLFSDRYVLLRYSREILASLIGICKDYRQSY